MASHNAPVRELPELTSLGNNDLELFWRLLRVVRRLDAQDNGLLGMHSGLICFAALPVTSYSNIQLARNRKLGAVLRSASSPH